VGLHDQWYKNAIIYCLDVETYADSNGDGVGDFPGLTRRLDYLSSLGVTCIWLMPCYPTPGRDDGYDVTDFTAIDPRFGSMADFTEFTIEARERGMHVLLDLVANHTSDQHPWFQEARSDPDSPYRDYYTWRTDDPGDTSDQVVFPGEQKGIWTYDEQAKAWYLHHFYSFQPELNFANERVRDEFRKIMGLWLQQGVQGFRIDAAPFLAVEHGPYNSEAHKYLAELKDFASLRSGNAILLGEVDVGLSTLADYFGGGNQLQALFNFPLNRFVFLGLAQQSSDPIRFGLSELPSIPGAGQWVNFLRHHDELNLSRLTKVQRAQVLEAFGPKKTMQSYGRGLRRRLAPMLDGDQRHLQLAYSLLFSLPGAPMVFYGEEIGMGENLELNERLSVRTPMQWTPYGSGGFSELPPEDWVRPPTRNGDYTPPKVNVGLQRGDPGSLLNFMAALMRTRRECSEIGTGKATAIETGSDPVLALRFDIEDSSVIVLNNLCDRACPVSLDLPNHEAATATDLLMDEHYPPLDGGKMKLNPYGYRWMRIGGVY
jgi:maltose alpha-D-glucosyltransferase/alpha-amylase